MDWLKQSQDMFKMWADAQQKMVSTLTDAVKKAGDMPSLDVWQRTVQTWESSVKNLIETQGLWARMWARAASAGSDLPNVDEFVKTIEDMTRTWVETQLQLWQNWFNMVKEFNPTQMNESMQDQVAKARDGWQDTMQKVMDVQADWAKQWMEMVQPGKDKS